MKKILSTLKAKWAEYLLEIFVLIIGIYGAFALDEWNETRKNQKLSADYYCRFYEDLTQDEQQVLNVIEFVHSRLEKSNLMLAELQKSQPVKSIVISHLLESTSRISYQFSPISAGYNDLKSSGNLNVFTDQEVKKQLGLYFQEAEGLAGNISTNGKIALDEIFEMESLFAIGFIDSPFFKEGLDTSIVDTTRLDRSPITPNQVYKLNHLAAVLIAINDRNLEHYKSILQKIEELKPLLQSRCKY